MTDFFHLSFEGACGYKAQNQNDRHGSKFPRRFTDHEIEDIERLLNKYKRLGKVDNWQLNCSQETTVISVFRGGDPRNSSLLNIRKFEDADGFFGYGTASAFNKTSHVTPNFDLVMKTVRLTLDEAPLIAQPILQLTPQG